MLPCSSITFSLRIGIAPGIPVQYMASHTPYQDRLRRLGVSEIAEDLPSVRARLATLERERDASGESTQHAASAVGARGEATPSSR